MLRFQRKNRKILLVGALLISFMAQARTAAEIFADAPNSVIPLLGRSVRLDMLDYYNSGLPTPSRNAMGGSARILSLDKDCIDVQVSRDASVQMAVLPMKNDTLIAVIETVHTPVTDSDVVIYRSDWSVAAQPKLPKAIDFVSPDMRKTVAGLDMPDPIFMRIEYEPLSQSFVFHNTTEGYYTRTDRPDGLNIMKTSIVMKFDGSRFKQ